MGASEPLYSAGRSRNWCNSGEWFCITWWKVLYPVTQHFHRWVYPIENLMCAQGDMYKNVLYSPVVVKNWKGSKYLSIGWLNCDIFT